MTLHSSYPIDPNHRIAFRNYTSGCVGTGHVGLGLHKEYQDQLELVQKEVGFTYLRGHGLLHKDLSICALTRTRRDEEGVIEYNFTYLDRLYDSYRRLHIKPFLEIGFMPEPLASGEQSIFWWKGNVTPPKEYAAWAELIKAIIVHLRGRYGDREVASWPVEVWNEPNLRGFWKDADLQEYLKLYDVTSRAVKEAFPDMRVGGPAICGGENFKEWLTAFLDYCRDAKAPLDFVTRHIYRADPPERRGHYTYHTMRPISYTINELNETRAAIDSYAMFRGMELHVTEFNTSYSPTCPLHDTNENAVLTAEMLAVFGDTSASYSYWTFGDVFEESGVPFSPFHGGFGLVANGCIPKPTLWTFAFFHRLTGPCVLREDNVILTLKEDGGYRGVAWNAGRNEMEITLSLPEGSGKAVLLTQTVNEEVCNPLKIWHDMGEPKSLTEAQLRFLRASAYPLHASVPVEGESCTLGLKANGLVYFEILPVTFEGDRGYDYSYYVKE